MKDDWLNGQEETIDATEILKRAGHSGTYNYRSKRSAVKDFIAWDGEGITYEGSQQQAYILLAASTGDYKSASEGKGLTTEDCFNLLFRVEADHPDCIHIGFGFGYDTNQILSSFTRSDLYKLSLKTKRGRSFKWHGYRIKIHPGKLFRVAKGMPGGNDYQCVTIYDTFGFFQRRFVDVVRAYDPDRLSSIESGKSNRGSFQYRDLAEIIEYCLAENKLLVEILEKLRSDFHRANIFPEAWYGPGAVANATLKSHKAKDYMGEPPKEVRNAAKFAYQSGRFEPFKLGYHNGPVWQYDINSAHPSAICELPQLSDGNWEHVRTFEPGTFSVWRCSYRDRRNGKYDKYFEYRAHPLFYRNEQGKIAYPYFCSGWYWEPEAALLTNIDYPADCEISEGWVWRPNNNIKPFEFIKDRYYERLEMKKRGDGAERALKLEMNSIYGKFAQRSGWFKDGDRIPTYHQLEWAGYITASTRAKLYQAFSLRPGGIVAFETDAIFSTVPIPGLKIGTALGEWSETKYDDILYIQSGFYFAHTGNSVSQSDSHVAKFRGFDKGSITFENVSEWLSTHPTNPFSRDGKNLTGTVNRFVGFRRALMSRRTNYWRSWEKEDREITIGREGKRIHMPGCPACRKGKGWMEAMHSLSCTHELEYGASYPHKIPWETYDFGNIWADEEEIDMTDGW